MRKQITFDIHPDHRTLRVWDGDLDSVETYHQVDNQLIAQGFSSRLQRSLNFFTLGDCTRLIVEVFYANEEDAVTVQDVTVRAILVPFITNGCLKVGDLAGHVEVSISSTPGQGVLLFEINPSVDEQYLNSSRYKENSIIGMTEEYCRLTLYFGKQTTQSSILRYDTEDSLPYPIQGYTAFEPTLPLVSEVDRL